MKELVINIPANGQCVYGLYDDSVAYRDLGEIETVRASDVRMNCDGFWEIYIISEDRVLPYSFLSRQEAIKHEVTYLIKKPLEEIVKQFKD